MFLQIPEQAQPCLLLSMYMCITRKRQSLFHDSGLTKAVPLRSLCVGVSGMAKLWLLQPERPKGGCGDSGGSNEF